MAPETFPRGKHQDANLFGSHMLAIERNVTEQSANGGVLQLRTPQLVGETANGDHLCLAPL